MIVLFHEKGKCCCCAACMNICPTQAITINSDADGFEFPEIDHDLCIECGLCNKVCDFQNDNINGNPPISTYVAINKDKNMLMSSASGGVFGALASLVLEKNGVVYGCAYNANMEPEHICTDNLLGVKKIQGSKYVQSNINTTYVEAKEHLKNDRWVLFTGTPCQIAGLKSFLGKDHNKLITADIICHGVPNAEFFKGYINYLEDKLKGKVIDLKFRDKSKGWGLLAKVIYEKSGTVKRKFIFPIDSYYYKYFLDGTIYRESCYECKYANSDRVGDFTMGDYWGVEKAHPEIKTKKGVSVLLVNSYKGMALLKDLSSYIDLVQSDFEKARINNDQLNHPTPKNDKREELFRMWNGGGYREIADDYYAKNKKRILWFKSKMLIPKSIKKYIKKLIRRGFSFVSK